MKVIKHGTIFDRTDKPYGYVGWPTVARMKDGQIVVGVSGLRAGHVCPWGKTLLFTSDDEAQTWSDFEIVNDTMLDDRDVGVTPLPDGGMLISWFSSDIRPHGLKKFSDRFIQEIDHYFEKFPKTKTPFELNTASTRRRYPDGEWGQIKECPVNTPHGPILNSNNELIYLGKKWYGGPLQVYKSYDNGDTWEFLSELVARENESTIEYHEPHIIELGPGIYMGAIRSHYNKTFCTLKTFSYDNCKTWTTPEVLTMDGTPPHFMRHSSGAIVMSYGNRRDPEGKFGERVVISYDNGKTFSEPFILCTATDSDLGYPSTIELKDGNLLTVYYQKPEGRDLCALLYTVWSL